jgi:hypothetical protein
MPTKTKGDVLIGGSAELQAEGRRDSIGVGHQTKDMNSTAVGGVGVGKFARHAHGVSDMSVKEERID